jgi:type I restriction enzyme S subunit
MNDTDEFPEHWEEATVKELCGQPRYGYTESATVEPRGPRFLRITDIQEDGVNWESVPYCPCDEPEKYRLADKDIVFARTGATTGKSYLVRNPPNAVFASYLIRIRPGERVLPEYVWWYFQSSRYWASVFGGIDDGNRPNMNGTKLAALRIPFPTSKTEQRRLVTRVEAVTSRAQELRALNASLVEDATHLLAAEYNRICHDAPTKPFGKVAKLVRRRVQTQPDASYNETGIRSFGKGTFHKPALTGRQLGNKRVFHIHPGDLVFMNVFAWEGAIAVAKPEDEGRVASHRFMMHEVDPAQATAEFLCYHLLTEHGLERIRAASPGSAGRNRTLGITKLHAIPVPVPPVAAQRRFSKLHALRDKLRRLQIETEAELAAFTPALLAKAFRGEL